MRCITIETKNAQVRRLVSKGEYKKALGICKDWRNGINPNDVEALRLGYECMLYPEFYKQIGKDPDLQIRIAIDVLQRIYG